MDVTKPDRITVPPSSLRVLILEDNPRDAKLMASALAGGESRMQYELTDSPELFRERLEENDYDVILADFNLRNWTAIDALEILKRSGKDVPLIVVTGSLGDEAAVECVKLGAADYVLKDHLSRLPVSVQRALEEKRLRTENRRAIEATSRLATIVESSDAAIIGRTLEGVITSWNKGAEKLYGYSATEVFGQPISILAPHDRLEEVAQILARLKKGESVELYESVRVRKDGSQVDVSLSVFPLTDSRGEVTGVASIARDITERKRAEDSLRESEERFRATFENSGIGVALVDMQGRSLKSNPALRQMLGYSEEEFSRMAFTEYTHPDDRELDWGLFSELAAGKWEKYEIEKRFLKKGGGAVWGLLTASLVKDMHGRPVCAVGMVQDISERKRAEEALQNEKAFSGSIIDSLPDIFYVLDSRGRYLRWNKNAEKILGYSREELVTLDPLANVTEDDRPWVASKIQEAFAKGSATAEVHLLSKDGREIPYILKATRVVIGDNVYLVGIGVDITARQRAEEQLYQSRQMLQTILDTIPQRVFWKDRNILYLGCNKALALDAGLKDPAEIIGKNDYELAWRETAEHYRADDKLVMEMETPRLNFEEPQNRPDGSLWWLRSNKLPLRDREGKVIGMIGTYEDITEQKEAEAEHIRLVTAIEQSAEAVVITNTNGDIEYVNPAFTRITGYSREEALGQNPRILKSGKQDPALYQQLWATILKGEIWRGEVINRKKDGSLYTEEMNIAPVRGARGEVTHFIATKQDVTERKTLEAQLQQAAKMEAIGRLAGGVAHDFNNLLTIINGYAELLLDKFAADKQVGGQLKQIQDAGERAASLTRQLLAFSRRQVLAPQVLDLNAVVSNVEKMLRRLIGEDIKLRTILDPTLGRVKADPGLIEQVIINLAVNARDAMPSGGSLTIETRNVELDEAYTRTHATVKPGPYVMLAVGDTGVGMTAETKTHMFEPFFTTKEKGKGTGLRLATVYGIVKQSGGSVWVYSELGQGTVFKVYLPTVSESPAAKGPAKTEPDSVSGSETILVVEDEEGVRSLIRLALESAGYKVLETEGTENALATCASYDGPIHLLLTDVVMPKMSGPLVAEKVTSLRPGIKILYMSGYTDDAVVHHGVLSQDMPFIQKPFSPVALRKKIREVLGGK